jgi:hypothetical protein
MPRIFPLLAVLGLLGSFAFAQNTSAQSTSAKNSGASQSSNQSASQSSDKSKPSPIVAKLDQKSPRSDAQRNHSKTRSGTNNQSAAYPNKAAGNTDTGTSKATSKPTAASPGTTENAESIPPPKATNNQR